MGKLGGFMRLVRPVNCLMMGFAVIVGAALANLDKTTFLKPDLLYGFVTGFTLTAASMSINDYYDREIDALNEPKRPIPSGTVKPREALVFALCLTAIGLVAALLSGIYSLVLAIFAWAVFVAYTTVGKRSGLPGNFLVSVCVAIPFVYGSVVVADTVELNVTIFALLAFLSNTGREITKGIVDVKGDQSRHVVTLAVRFGNKQAAAAAVVFYLLAVSLSLVPWYLGLVSWRYVPFVAVTDVGLVGSSLLLIRDHSRENARRIKNAVLLWFVFGLLAFVAGATG